MAIVESRHVSAHESAVVFEADGSERFRITVPVPDPPGHWFDQMYYVKGELTAFAVLRGDRAMVVDERTGHILRNYETR